MPQHEGYAATLPRLGRRIMSKKKPAPLIRWSAGLHKLKAITIRQPWAWLVVNGYKDIENRKWATHHRGPLLIHAGSSRADLHIAVKDHIERKYGVKISDEYVMGAIIGVVDVVDCVTAHPSPWFNKSGFGWVLARPRRLPTRPCKGKLKIFEPDL